MSRECFKKRDNTLTYSISEVLKANNIYFTDNFKFYIIKQINKIENILENDINNVDLLELNTNEFKLLEELLQFKMKLEDIKNRCKI